MMSYRHIMCFYFDFAKAFDSANHDIILKKLGKQIFLGKQIYIL